MELWRGAVETGGIEVEMERLMAGMEKITG
jgi:hypothetical protein